MGLKVEPPRSGADCGHWEPPDETPIAIWCMFHDVIKGGRFGAREPPNGHIFRLDQDDPLPCQWKIANLAFGWEVTFSIQAAVMSLDLRDAVHRNDVYFTSNIDHSPPADFEVFGNELWNCPNEFGCGGFGTVYMMPRLIEIADSIQLLGVPDLRAEIFPAADSKYVVKYCSLSLHTNVSLKISP